jgi:hypothetical protein
VRRRIRNGQRLHEYIKDWEIDIFECIISSLLGLCIDSCLSPDNVHLPVPVIDEADSRN